MKIHVAQYKMRAIIIYEKYLTFNSIPVVSETIRLQSYAKNAGEVITCRAINTKRVLQVALHAYCRSWHTALRGTVEVGIVNHCY